MRFSTALAPGRRATRRRAAAICGFIGVFILAGNDRAGAQPAAQVLVVVNDATPAGGRIAARYAERRSVPADNICHITTTPEEAIERTDYARQIEGPIWACIATRAAHDRILYIVLTKGVPLRINGSAGRTGTVASVDSELTLLYRRATGQQSPVAGWVANPYFAGAAQPSTLKPFSHEQQDIYLVTRLDGYTVDDAIALIDRSAEASRDGRFVFDERVSLNDRGNLWLRTAASRLRDSGFAARVLLDQTAKVVTDEKDVLGYYSWGSNDPAIRIRHFGLGFRPGALAAMYVSTDGRTFTEPPDDWTPGANWNDRRTFFAGSPQSLAADFVRDGITGTAGHVTEPFLEAAIRPDVLFPAYVNGLNLAEAFYAAMPYLSWQTIVLGDPLCAPFQETTASARVADPALDPATELPAYFARRRVGSLSPSVNATARSAFVRAETRAMRGDAAGAREALEQAVAADSRFTAARLALAGRLELAGEFDKASAQYRSILKYAPNEPVSLNNLAYSLAIRENNPAAALPLAERAASLTPAAPAVRDTLAWVQHLLGRDGEAAKNISLARDGAKANAEIRWHAAVIFAAINDQKQAAAELEAALQLDPTLSNRTELQDLRSRLNAAPPGR